MKEWLCLTILHIKLFSDVLIRTRKNIFAINRRTKCIPKRYIKNGRQITNSKTEVRERIVPPAELARLGRKLILLTSGEYYILRKNFYFESSLWDRIIKYMKNLSREDEEDFPTENTLALDKKKEKI